MLHDKPETLLSMIKQIFYDFLSMLKIYTIFNCNKNVSIKFVFRYGVRSGSSEATTRGNELWKPVEPTRSCLRRWSGRMGLDYIVGNFNSCINKSIFNNLN